MIFVASGTQDGRGLASCWDALDFMSSNRLISSFQ